MITRLSERRPHYPVVTVETDPPRDGMRPMRTARETFCLQHALESDAENRAIHRHDK